MNRLLITALGAIAILQGCNSELDNSLYYQSKISEPITADTDISLLPQKDLPVLPIIDVTQSGQQELKLSSAPLLDMKQPEISRPIGAGSMMFRSHSVHNPSYVPLGGCPELNINLLYTFTPGSGAINCFYFEIPQDSRTEFIALGQTAGTQTNIEVFHDVQANYGFELLGTSTESDADDSVVTFTESGHYYFQLRNVVADGSSIQFAVASNTNIDAFEHNDRFDHAFELEGDINTINANLDHITDVDHYVFNAANGQNVFLRLNDFFGNNEWSLELLNGGSWVPLASNSDWLLGGIASGSDVFVRVIHRAGAVHNANHTYQLTFGSRIMAIDNVDVDTTENIVRITSAWFNSPYLTTQFHNELNWKAKIEDSTGAGIEGVTIQFTYATADIPVTTLSAITDASGFVDETIVMPDCVGDRTIYHEEPFGLNEGRWSSDIVHGAWFITVPESRADDDVGVGGDNVPDVQIGHICDQTYLGPLL
jgi:hypothetical protein